VRWSVRNQLLLPLFLLLAGVIGLSVWMGAAAADRAHAQIEDRLRDVARFLSDKTWFQLKRPILDQVKDLSGADYLLVDKGGGRTATFPDEGLAVTAGAVWDKWQEVRLGPPITVAGTTYLCSGIRVAKGPNAGDVVYIFYPENLLRDARSEAVWPFVFLGCSFGVASVVLAIMLGSRLGGRIQQLEQRTRLIAAGDFSPMPLPPRNDEIRDLTTSINEMAQQLAQLQEAIRRTERLRLLGQVSGGLAHQLRNGLTGARLAVQLFLRESAGQTDTAALDVALRQLTLLETRLKRFLDLGRQEDLRREPCSLTALVSEALDLLRPQCRHAGIDLRWQPPSADSVVEGDAGQLGQLVLNVIGNAVEAAGPGGSVEVSLRPSSPSANGATPPVVLEVTDSGLGPPAEVAERLFEPFVTSKPEGVGLGLAVARQAAESHGGRIRWQRSDNRTVFRIELPPLTTARKASEAHSDRR
jgi:signal transduction histidine kinase